MKTLSLTQPWASLVAIGAKRVETRSWFTRHRDLLAIHASSGFPPWARELVEEEPFQAALAHGGIYRLSDFPLGSIVAITRVIDCITIPLEYKHLQQHPRYGKLFTEQEREFGNYGEQGRYAWILDEMKQDGDTYQFTDPIPVKGSRGLWDWEPEYDSALLLGER